MNDRRTVIRRLHRIGAVNSFLGRSEVQHLHKVLRPYELIEYALCGTYQSTIDQQGYGMLAATDQRLLIIDRIFGQTLIEEIPYDNLSEVDYGIGPLNGTLTFTIGDLSYSFKSVKTKRLAKMAKLLHRKLHEHHHRILPNYGFEPIPYPIGNARSG